MNVNWSDNTVNAALSICDDSNGIADDLLILVSWISFDTSSLVVTKSAILLSILTTEYIYPWSSHVFSQILFN